jgi:hypothetical protein
VDSKKAVPPALPNKGYGLKENSWTCNTFGNTRAGFVIQFPRQTTLDPTAGSFGGKQDFVRMGVLSTCQTKPREFLRACQTNAFKEPTELPLGIPGSTQNCKTDGGICKTDGGICNTDQNRRAPLRPCEPRGANGLQPTSNPPWG